MNFKLVAIDIDGTLLNSNLEISLRTVEAIEKAVQKGVKVTLCTGRMFTSAFAFAKQLKLDAFLITYNGALVKNSVSEEVIYHRKLPFDEAVHTIKLCRKLDIQLNLFHNDSVYVERTTAWLDKYLKRVGVSVRRVDDFMEFMQEEPVKLLAMGEEEVLQELRKSYRDRDVYLTRSMPNFLEVLNKEATKGRGLTAVIDAYGFKKEETLVIGDNQNDIEMFKYAGYSIAMDNAEDSIKRFADYITASNDEDGVAKALEKFVLV